MDDAYARGLAAGMARMRDAAIICAASVVGSMPAGFHTNPDCTPAEAVIVATAIASLAIADLPDAVIAAADPARQSARAAALIAPLRALLDQFLGIDTAARSADGWSAWMAEEGVPPPPRSRE